MARTFNGSSDFLQVTRQAALEPPFPMAVGCWIRSSAPGNFRYAINKGDSPGDHGSYSLSTSGAGAVRLIVSTGPSAAEFVASPASSAAFDGGWHHVLGTYDGANLRLYVDGTEAGTGTANTAAVHYNTAGDVFIGAFDATQLYIAADLADVALWAAVPTADERAALARGVRASLVRPDALRGLWPLFGGFVPEPDLSPSRASVATTSGTTAAATSPPVGPIAPAPTWSWPAASGGADVTVVVSEAAAATATAPTPTVVADVAVLPPAATADAAALAPDLSVGVVVEPPAATATAAAVAPAVTTGLDRTTVFTAGSPKRRWVAGAPRRGGW